MTTRTVHPDKGLPQLGPELNLDWRIWLAQHGLPDSDRIVHNGPIVCDDDARTAAARCFVKNDHGHSILDREHPNELLTEWVVVQLEAPALPFPAGFPVTVE
jgi:hypothetical protein